MVNIKRIYWDSDCFLAWFKNEVEKVEKCKGTIYQAEKGNIKLITSAITLTEVIKLKGKENIKKEDEEKIVAFFEQPYIIVVNVDRKIAEDARQLIWNNPSLNPKDSIHLATSMHFKLSELHTFDDGLLKFDNLFGSPPMKICVPNIAHQEPINFLDEEKKE